MIAIASSFSNHCDPPKTRIGPLKHSSTLLLVYLHVLLAIHLALPDRLA